MKRFNVFGFFAHLKNSNKGGSFGVYKFISTRIVLGQEADSPPRLCLGLMREGDDP